MTISICKTNLSGPTSRFDHFIEPDITLCGALAERGGGGDRKKLLQCIKRWQISRVVESSLLRWREKRGGEKEENG